LLEFGAEPCVPLKSSQKASERPEGGVSVQAPGGVGVGAVVVVSAVVVVEVVVIVGAVVVVAAVVVVVVETVVV
jgi:hypothetical protein